MPDTEALERKRLRDAEEWRMKQLRAGVSSEDNSNFQVGTVMRLVQMHVLPFTFSSSRGVSAPRGVCWTLMDSNGPHGLRLTKGLICCSRWLLIGGRK